MSIPAMNWCIEQRHLPPGQWVVLFHLCHMHNEEFGCFPSQAFLAEKTNMSKRTLVRHLADLETGGYITRHKRFNSAGHPISDRYTFGFDTSVDAPGRPSAKLTSGQSVHDQVPNGAQNVHEMAPKHEVTVKEHEEPPIVPRDAVRSILAEWASEAAVTSFMAFRKRQKKPLTERGAVLLAGHLRQIFDAGGDTDEALAMAELNCWSSVQPDWYWKRKNGNGTGKAETDHPTLRAIARAAAAF